MHVMRSCACVWFFFLQLQSTSFFSLYLLLLHLFATVLKVNYCHSWPICSLLDHILRVHFLKYFTIQFLTFYLKYFQFLLNCFQLYIYNNMLNMASMSKHLFSFWLNSNTSFLYDLYHTFTLYSRVYNFTRNGHCLTDLPTRDRLTRVYKRSFSKGPAG